MALHNFNTMARIKFTALVESIRGSIGGTTFQRNAYGFTAKAKPNMLNPWTEYQNIQKNQMSYVAKAWRTLTDAQRLDWQTWAEANPRPARLNPDSYLSGYNLFMLYHRYKGLTDNSILTSPSLVLNDMGAIEYLAYLDSGNLIWEVNPDGNTGSWTALLFMTNVIPYGREFVNTTPRYIASNDYNTGDTLDVSAQFQLKVGQLPPADQWIGMKMVVFNNANAQVIVGPTQQVQIVEV